jgi:undecaprenyl-diphosphatase
LDIARDVMNAFDQYLVMAVNRGIDHTPFRDWLIGTVFDLPSLKMLPLVAALSAIWLAASPKAEDRKIVLRAVIGAIIALIISRVIQDFGPFRVRPIHSISLQFRPPLGINPAVVEHSSSFPSDHAALAFALSGGIFAWSRKLGIAAIVLSVITTCFARVYAGYHYPSDVVVGAALGLTSAWVARFVPVDRLQAMLEREDGLYPFLINCFAFCAAYQVVTLFWDFRFAASSIAAIFYK